MITCRHLYDVWIKLDFICSCLQITLEIFCSCKGRKITSLVLFIRVQVRTETATNKIKDTTD